MGGNILLLMARAPHKGGDSVDSYQTNVVNDEELYVNITPSNLGKRVTEPHDSYRKLKNSVKEYLNHMDRDAQLVTDLDKKINVLGISSTNLNDDVAPRKSTSEQALVYALDYANDSI
jgi:hypothetical protein